MRHCEGFIGTSTFIWAKCIHHFLHVFQRPNLDYFLILPHINLFHMAVISAYKLNQILHYTTFYHILHGVQNNVELYFEYLPW